MELFELVQSTYTLKMDLLLKSLRSLGMFLSFISVPLLCQYPLRWHGLQKRKLMPDQVHMLLCQDQPVLSLTQKCLSPK